MNIIIEQYPNAFREYAVSALTTLAALAVPVLTLLASF